MQEIQAAEIDKRKTPSIHDCTQIHTANRSFINATDSESCKMTLTVTESVYMAIGATYEIFPYGLKVSNRKARDGFVYAGSQTKDNNIWINDIILPKKEKGIGKKHFVIKFCKDLENPDRGSFMIKDLGDGMGTFLRISRPLCLKLSNVVSFGESHLIAKTENESLSIRFIDGPRKDEKL